MRRDVRRLIIAIAALTILALFVVPWLGGFATDWLWFREVGFTTVFMTSLFWRVALFVIGGVVAYAILGGNVRLATPHRASVPALYIHRVNQPPIDVSRIVPRILRLGALFVSFLVAVSMSALWMTYVQALHGAAVGASDPLFHRDIGYYMFRLPAISATLGVLIALTVLSLAAVTLVYALRGQLPVGPGRPAADPVAERHVGALLAGLFVLTAVRLWIVRSAELLYSTTGPLVGASYTDVHVMLPGIRASAVVALLAAGLVVYGMLRGRLLRHALIAVTAYAAVSLATRLVLPLAVQKLSVLPNELVKEAPYLKDHIAATRAAWGISNVQTAALSGEATLTMADIKANSATINNVRLWERDLLQQTFKQLQEIRTYYDFVSVNDDRYTIQGQYRQVHLSARELNTTSLPTQTFINDRLTFTHGMGVTMAPVNQVTDEGLPVLFVKDLPPASPVGISLKRPEIYYGQLTSGLRVRGHEAEGVRLSGGRQRRLHVVRRGRRRAGGVVLPAGALCLGVRVGQDPVLERHHRLGAHHVPPGDHGSRDDGAAVPELRRRPVSRDHGLGRAGVGARRLHDEQRLSVLGAGGRRELHAQQREGDDQRVQRGDHGVRDDAGRSGDPDVRGHLPRHLQAAGGHAGGHPPRICAIRASCSASRRRCRRRTTWTARTRSTTARTSGRFRRRATRAATRCRSCGTSSCGCPGRRRRSSST